MSPVLPFPLCNQNPAQLHKETRGISVKAITVYLDAQIPTWRREGRMSQQPKAQIFLTHCSVPAVSSSCFHASNVFCWVTAWQGIFPSWLTPSPRANLLLISALSCLEESAWVTAKADLSPFYITSPFFLATARTSLYLWSVGIITAALGNCHLSHLLSILLTNLCQRMSVNAFYGDFLWHKLLWQLSTCNTPAAFAALMLQQLAQPVSTLSLAKSFLASVDKLSRTYNPALTKPGQESVSGAVFSHSGVLKHFGFDFSGLTSLGPPRSTLTSQVTELEAPVFSNNKQCVLKQVGSKSKLWGSNPAFGKPDADVGQGFIVLFITCFRDQNVRF